MSKLRLTARRSRRGAFCPGSGGLPAGGADRRPGRAGHAACDEQRNTDAPSQAYQDGVDDLGKSDYDAAFARFGAAADKPTCGLSRAQALMQQAGVRMSQKRTPEAVKLFDSASRGRDVQPRRRRRRAPRIRLRLG